MFPAVIYASVRWRDGIIDAKTRLQPAQQKTKYLWSFTRLFSTDPESVTDIAELAMSIEAQALDLYMRAAEKSRNAQSRDMLMQIAAEEQTHLKQLGKLIESIA